MIDPAMFGKILWMVALAVPVVLLYEAFVMSSVSYFLGFSAKASTTIGTSMSGRGVEAILYASVGSRLRSLGMGARPPPASLDRLAFDRLALLRDIDNSKPAFATCSRSL
jgi:Kef-type K+ transport system membrane component KefB